MPNRPPFLASGYRLQFAEQARQGAHERRGIKATLRARLDAAVRRRVIDQMRQQGAEVAQYRTGVLAGALRQVIDHIVAQHGMQLVARHRLIRAGADPGRHDAAQTALFEFLDKRGQAAWIVIDLFEQGGQQCRLTAGLGVSATDG